jgi:hypothetical protein
MGRAFNSKWAGAGFDGCFAIIHSIRATTHTTLPTKATSAFLNSQGTLLLLLDLTDSQNHLYVFWAACKVVVQI